MKPQDQFFELFTAFWKENDYEPFSSAQIAVYFYLIYRANSHNWEMPFKCSTTLISHSLKLSQQAVIQARDGVQKRGLIKFSKGNARKESPLYTLILDPIKWKEESHSSFISPDSNNLNKNPKNLLLDLETLNSKLLSDLPWLTTVSSHFNLSKEDVKDWVNKFFEFLKKKDFTHREEEDCRKHFNNWLNKKLANQIQTINPSTYPIS